MLGRGIGATAIMGMVVMLAVLALLPGKAQADLSGIKLYACVPTSSFCADTDTIQANTPFAISLRFTVNRQFSAGDRIYVKGPDGTKFSNASQWGFEIGQHKYEQRGSDFDVLDDGRIIRAKVFETLYPPLSPGTSVLAEFGEVGTMAQVGPIGSFRVAVWTNTEEAPVMSNSIKVSDGPPPTFRELTTKIRTGPSGRTSGKRVKFTFGSKGSTSFMCRLDSGAWKSCDSPKRYRVAKGKHTFRVRAVGSDGKLGPIVKHSFRRV